MKGETRVFDIQDVLIIGGGPCGLAVAARLHESTPSALFTDSEHQRVSGVHLSLPTNLFHIPLRQLK